jgi:regulator of sigma E protease
MSPLLIVLAIVALAVLIVVHEAGHMVVARLCGMRVDRFSIGFGPALVKFKRGETIYQISAIPFGGFVQIAGLNPNDDGILADDPRSYPNRPVYQRLLTIFAGPGTNYLFAAVMAAGIYTFIGEPREGSGHPFVVQVVENMPAQAAGVKLNDEFVSINGTAINKVEQVPPLVDASGGKPVTMVMIRDGKEVTLNVTPVQNGGHWRIGVSPAGQTVYVRVGVGTAVKDGLAFPYIYTRFIVHQFGEIFRGKAAAEFSGPPGIVKELKRQIERGPGDGLLAIAIISVYLGLFNLLPLPALDGGRLVFLGIEGLMRRRVNQKVEQTIHLVGMFALLSLVVIFSFKDIFFH